ncbi:glucokinase [Apophysomyces sp. BC1034]|nr:glucokinase [Apophysomyces sp. BC1015]KAG0174610.1 glucokinase [Apophysomyces sp. BC1021]KAG0185851.1 glucokinase [Apophysomyces sp. BC1034]
MDPLDSIRPLFDLTPETFKVIVDGFKLEYDHGLNTASASGLATMIPSFVTRLPTGQEKGTFLALDLGGSTLRVSAVKLLGNGLVDVREVRRQIAMSDPLRTGSCETFFDWMADAVAELVEQIPAQPLSMGVCWSFPIDQTDIAKGTSLRMGKGFNLKGIEGQDLQTLFSQAFIRKGLNVDVTALLNDTVGTLIAHAYTNPKARVGFIYGTGVNAAYPEKVSKIVKLQNNNALKPDTNMLVNTEIDIFGSEDYLPINRFDRALDASHNQPEFQLYEKMMSGAYLGELFRLVAMELVSQNNLFQGNLPTNLQSAWTFQTSAMSDIERSVDRPTDERLEQLEEIFQFDDKPYVPTKADLRIVTDICQMVSCRAAALAGASLASLIEQQSETLLNDNSDDIVIGVTGSTFELYPRMRERIQDALTNWFGPSTATRIRLEIATDGGGIGGALIAMLHEK